MIRPFKLVYPSGPTLLQTVNVKVDTGTPVITNWNIWTNGASNTTPFVNTSSVSTGFLLVDVNSEVISLATYSAVKSDVDFPDAVINRLVYTGQGKSKSMKLTGLDNSKTYSLLFCSFANDADASDNTDITVQGVTKFAAVDTNVIFKTSFTGVVPIAGEISIVFQGSPVSTKYGCMNAFILKEYT